METERLDRRVRRSREKIITAALELFVAGGEGNITLDAIVARTGLAKTTIYRHWTNREALVLDVFRHFDHRFVPPTGDTPLARLQDLTRQLAATLTLPQWIAAMPSLLDVMRRIEEFAAPHELGIPGTGPMTAVIGEVLRDAGLEERTTPMEMLLLIVGPLTLGVLLAPATITAEFADRLVVQVVHGLGAPRGE